MNTFTHLGIAGIIERAVEDELSVKLDAFAFRYGSVEPDISPALIKIPHYKQDAEDFVRQQIRNLIYLKKSTFPICTRQFSERLGVITHYLSDFFCYVHSANYKGGTLGHYLYEMNLSNYCKMHPRLMKAHKNSRFTQINPSYKSICSYIDEQHNKYIERNPSYEIDMDFTLRVCISVCLSIISACMAEEMISAA